METPKENPVGNAPLPGTPVSDAEAGQRRTIIISVLVVLLVVALTVTGLVLLIGASLDTVARVRDIFIIFLALESLLIGITLVILIIQLARLLNLLQNEIKPILDSTNETVSHLRGTTVFLSENLAEPVIKLSEYMAGLTQALQILGLARKKPRN